MYVVPTVFLLPFLRLRPTFPENVGNFIGPSVSRQLVTFFKIGMEQRFCECETVR